MKKFLLQSAKSLFVVLLLGSMSVYAAPFVGPTFSPTVDNAPLPINVSDIFQTKNGMLGVGELVSLRVASNTAMTGLITADNHIFSAGNVWGAQNLIAGTYYGSSLPATIIPPFPGWTWTPAPHQLATGTAIADQFCLTGGQGSVQGCIQDWGSIGALPQGNPDETLRYDGTSGQWVVSKTTFNDDLHVSIKPIGSIPGAPGVHPLSQWGLLTLTDGMLSIDLTKQAIGSSGGRNLMRLDTSWVDPNGPPQDAVIQTNSTAFMFYGDDTYYGGQPHYGKLVKLKAGSIDLNEGPVSIDLNAKQPGSFEGRTVMDIKTSPIATGSPINQPAVFRSDTGIFRFVKANVATQSRVSTYELQADSLATPNPANHVCADQNGVLVLCNPSIAASGNYDITYAGANGGPFPNPTQKMLPGPGVAACPQCNDTNFVVPTGVYKIKVSLVGSGGAGNSYGSAMFYNPGGGGQAGGYASAFYDVQPGQRFFVTAAPLNVVDATNGGGNPGSVSQFGGDPSGPYPFLFGYGGAGGGHTTGGSGGCSLVLPPLQLSDHTTIETSVATNGAYIQGGRLCGGYLGGDLHSVGGPGGDGRGDPFPMTTGTAGTAGINNDWDTEFPIAGSLYEYGHGGMGNALGSIVGLGPNPQSSLDGKAGAVVVQWSTANNGYGTCTSCDSHSTYDIWSAQTKKFKIPLKDSVPVKYQLVGGGGGGAGSSWVSFPGNTSGIIPGPTIAGPAPLPGYNGTDAAVSPFITFYTSLGNGMHTFEATVGAGGLIGTQGGPGSGGNPILWGTPGHDGHESIFKDLTINYSSPNGLAPGSLGGALFSVSPVFPYVTPGTAAGSGGGGEDINGNGLTPGRDGHVHFEW